MSDTMQSGGIKKSTLKTQIKKLREENKRLRSKSKSRSRSKSKSKKRKSSKPRKRSRSRSKSRSKKKSDSVRYFKLITPDGKEIGGRYTGITPQQAAKKLRSQYFGNNNSRVIYLKQTSSGPNHNYVYSYKVTRKRVPATLYIRKLTGNNYMYIKDAEPIRKYIL